MIIVTGDDSGNFTLMIFVASDDLRDLTPAITVAGDGLGRFHLGDNCCW